MEAAIWGTAGLLFVSALSGLAYLAVKHPHTYVTYGRYLLWAVGSLVPLSLAFTVGSRFGILSVRRFIPEADFPSAMTLAAHIDIACFGVAIAALIMGSFLLLLAKISVHIHDHEGSKDGRDGEGE